MERQPHFRTILGAGIIVLAAVMFLLWWYPSRSDQPRTANVNEPPPRTDRPSPVDQFHHVTPPDRNSATNSTAPGIHPPDTSIAVSEPVSESLARKAAESFLQTEQKRTSNTNEGVNLKDFKVSKTAVVAQSGGSPLAYVHTLSPTGFIVTAAQTGIRPVVAFSFKGSFSFQDSADNALLHLLRADMTARAKALHSGGSQDSVQSNLVQWATLNQE